MPSHFAAPYPPDQGFGATFGVVAGPGVGVGVVTTGIGAWVVVVVVIGASVTMGAIVVVVVVVVVAGVPSVGVSVLPYDQGWAT